MAAVKTTDDSCWLRSYDYQAMKTPSAVQDASFFATNSSGTVFYAIALRRRLVLDAEAGTIVQEIEKAEISKTVLLTGVSVNYKLDAKLTAADMRQALDCYVLEEDVLCLLVFDRSTFELRQLVVVLCPNVRMALVLSTKRTTLPMGMDLCLDVSLLDRGQIAIVGCTGAFDDPRKKVAACLLAANPACERRYPFVNVSERIRSFRHFLRDLHPDSGIFPRGVTFDVDGIYFLIKNSTQMLESNQIGRLLYDGSGGFSCDLVTHPNKLIFHGGLMSNHVLYAVLRGKSLWMALDPPDFNLLMTWKWRVYLNCLLPFFLGCILVSLRFMFWIRRWDGGRCINGFVRLLGSLFGPNHFPPMEPPPVFLLYNLDFRSFQLRRAVADVSLTAEGRYNLALDVDATGSLLLLKMPVRKSTDPMHLSYYHSTTQVPTLGRLAAHRSYRLFPGLDESVELRRWLGEKTRN